MHQYPHSWPRRRYIMVMHTHKHIDRHDSVAFVSVPFCAYCLQIVQTFSTNSSYEFYVTYCKMSRNISSTKANPQPHAHSMYVHIQHIKAKNVLRFFECDGAPYIDSKPFFCVCFIFAFVHCLVFCSHSFLIISMYLASPYRNIYFHLHSSAHRTRKPVRIQPKKNWNHEQLKHGLWAMKRKGG